MWRRISLFLAFTSLSCLFQGCAIAPAQMDVTHISTPDIVANIRCETRDVIRGQLGGYLLADKEDPVAQDIASQLADRKRPLSSIDLRGLHWDKKRQIAAYRDFAVVYDFTFDGTINTNINGAPTATSTFTRGTRTFPFSGKIDRSRQNVQNFRLTDTFGGLLRDTSEGYCPEPHRPQPRRYMYPISGEIGIKALMQDFVDIYGFAPLASRADDKSGPPSMSWTLSFTTTIEGTANPAVMINPVVGSTTWSGKYGLTSSRTDLHKAIIAFAASDARLTDAEVDAFLQAPGAASPPRSGLTSGTASAKANAAADQAIVRFELGRQSNVVVVNQGILPFL